MPIEVPSEKTTDYDNCVHPKYETRLTAEDMLWNRDNSTGYRSGEETRYGDEAPRRAFNTSLVGFNALNRTNPIYGTTQSPSPEDSQQSSPEEQ